MTITAELHDGTRLEFPDGTSPEVIQGTVKKQLGASVEAKPQESSIKNALYGFAARGNQAINALNPLSSQESNDKISSEQEWVKQHNGAGIGSMLADMAITVPAGGPAASGVRALTSGAIEGATHSGDILSRLKEMLSGTAGAGVGEGLGHVVGFLAKPFAENASAASSALRQKAANLGLKLTAAQQTGNKTLQYMDSALDFIPSSSTAQREFKDAQRSQWQKSLFGQGGEHADEASQTAMGAMKSRISGVYKDVSSRNNINMDQELKNALDNIASARNLDRMDVNKRNIVKSYLDEFNSAPVGSQFSGAGYQNTRSMLDKQFKSLRNSNPQEAEALGGIRSAIDSAMERSVSPTDAKAWKGANNDWSVMKTIEKGVNPATEEISPNLVINELKRRNPNRMIYGRGDQKLNDIAKVGKEFIAGKTADSGTAQRSAMIKLLTGAGVAGAGTDLAYSHDPGQAAMGGAGAVAAAILMPRAASKAMLKQGGYLSNGLIDLSKEALPGMTRQRLINEVLRNSGLQITNSLNDK